MSEKKSHGPSMHQRLTRWESVLAMVLLLDTIEERIIFRAQELPAWGKVSIKMAVIVGLLGAILHFVNKQIDGGLSVTRSLGGRSFVPRFTIHALLLGAFFVGFYWLKIQKLPWEP